jgi:predicted PurR-regulated permease PerM
MKISHRQIRLILRILYCLGAFFGSFVFIYEIFIRRSITYSICYASYFLVTAAILYLLFARKRPTRRFAYGTFYAMCFVTVLFFLSYIYESATMVSDMTNELIDHIEHDKEINPFMIPMITISKLVYIIYL